MINKYLYIILVIITSCNSIRYIDIQVLSPSENTLPQNISQLYIIKSPNIIGVTDSVHYNLFFQNFYPNMEQELKNAPLFDSKKIELLSWDDFRNIYAKSSFNERKHQFYLKLDSLIISDTTYYSTEFSGADEGEVNSYELLEHRVIYHLFFLIQNLASSKNYIQLTLKDTVVWEFPKYVIQNSKILKIIIQNHFLDLGKIVAEKFSKEISPYWNTTERVIFYNSSKYMRKGYKQFVLNNLDSAIVKWSAAYYQSNPLVSSRAAYNMALTYEVADNLQSSKYWINKAIETKNDSIYQNYKKIILKRIEEKDKIDKQL